MKSLVELQAQIEDLQKQAAVVRTRQYAKAVADIAATMKAFGISLDEVRKALAKKGAARPKKAAKAAEARPGPKAKAKKAAKPGRPKKARKPVPVKFKGPKGETWTGRGKQPVWLRDLLKDGRALDEFKV